MPNVVDLPPWVADWIGLPYVDHGRDRRGVDCWGLVALVAKSRGVELPSFDDYRDGDDSARIAEIMQVARGLFRKVEQPGVGDIVELRVAGRACHVGICVGDTWFLHAQRYLGSAIERWDSNRWRSRVEGFYRWAP